MFNILVLVIESARLERKRLQSFSCVLFHLHAEIIACFLFSALLLLHPLYCPTVSDGWKLLLISLLIVLKLTTTVCAAAQDTPI